MICATFIHEQGYKFTINYKHKGRFLTAIDKSRHCSLDNAVDYDGMVVITQKNFDDYKKKQQKNSGK